MLRFLFNRALRRSRLVASSILFGALTGILAALLVPLVLSARAHEDHDHGPAEAIAGQLAPRVAARSELFELVGILRGERLVIYLDRFASNEPVTSADIAVMIGDTTEPVNAERSARVVTPWSRHALRPRGRSSWCFRSPAKRARTCSRGH